MILPDGAVVTIQLCNGTYITACEDKKTVQQEKELRVQRSNNPQHWTLVEDACIVMGARRENYHLKSIYGKFLSCKTGAHYYMCQKNDQSIKHGLHVGHCGHWLLHKTSKNLWCTFHPRCGCSIWSCRDIQVVNTPSPTTSARHLEHLLRSGKHPVVNIFNIMAGTGGIGGGGSDPYRLYNAGQNANGSGNQENGDLIHFQHQPRRHNDHFYFFSEFR